LAVVSLGAIEFQLAMFLAAQIVKDGCADAQLIGGLLAGNLVIDGKYCGGDDVTRMRARDSRPLPPTQSRESRTGRWPWSELASP
jgi:hypothetical protein